MALIQEHALVRLDDIPKVFVLECLLEILSRCILEQRNAVEFNRLRRQWLAILAQRNDFARSMDLLVSAHVAAVMRMLGYLTVS